MRPRQNGDFVAGWVGKRFFAGTVLRDMVVVEYDSDAEHNVSSCHRARYGVAVADFRDLVEAGGFVQGAPREQWACRLQRVMWAIPLYMRA